jgi:ABC-type transport system involved in multi-copper enzyme maturation permease subunit
MNHICLLGVVDVWVSTWLTPIWILGVGAAAGLVLLLIAWGVAAALSQFPVIGTLQQTPELRWRTSLLLAAVMIVLAVPLVVWLVWRTWIGQGLDDALVTLLILLCALGAAVLVLPQSLIALVSRRTVSEIPDAVREGVLWPILILTSSFAVFGIVGVVVVPQSQRVPILASLMRLPYSGTTTTTHVIDAPAQQQLDEIGITAQTATPIDVAFRGSELLRLQISSDETVQISPQPFTEVLTPKILDITAGEQFSWHRNPTEENLFPDEDFSTLYVRNLGSGPATLQITIATAPPYPEVAAIPITAVSVVLIFLLYVLHRSLMPRLSAIALSTAKSEMAQPLFLLLVAAGVCFLIIFVYVPYYTFGEDIKVLKDSGLTLIMVLCIVQAIWAASTSISDEIEGRTALTVLSKPIGRREFILGKFLGIVWTVAVMFLLLGAVFLIVVAYKPIYDARESNNPDATWQLCYSEMIRIVPGLALALMETVVLTALSVAISTRLPMLANFMISTSIYVLGHLTPLIMQTSADRFEIVKFFGQLIATVIPVLDHFNVQAAVAGGAEVPYNYLGWSLLYCFLYGTIAMLLALVMFEDRDLA